VTILTVVYMLRVVPRWTRWYT